MHTWTHRALASAVVVAALAGLTASPAAAHRDSDLSFFACASRRQNASHVVDHSHFRWSNRYASIFSCATHDVDTRCGYDVITWFEGHRVSVITGPYNVKCRQIP